MGKGKRKEKEKEKGICGLWFVVWAGAAASHFFLFFLWGGGLSGL